jgi:DNA-binding response OmpR family regulator
VSAEAELAFIDLDPALHGCEICRAAAQHMPVIALLGAGDEPCEEVARDYGACGCLEKPINAAGVRAVLDETLGVKAPIEL